MLNVAIRETNALNFLMQNSVMRTRAKGFWQQKQNQKQFFENTAKVLGISNPSEWGKVSTFQIQHFGGSTLLQMHNNSILNTLIAVFPGILKYRVTNLEQQWKKEWFSNIPTYPLGYWKNRNNQRNFLTQIARILNIQEPKDWGKNMMNQVIELGGGSLLQRFKGSLFQTLEYAFPGL